MTEAIDQRSPLLDLPPELRNRIYEYALAETEAVQLTNRFGEVIFASPGLLATCRQIRGEAKGVYLAENSFMIRRRVNSRGYYRTALTSRRLGTKLLSSWLRQWVGKDLMDTVHKLYFDGDILPWFDKTEAAHWFDRAEAEHKLAQYRQWLRENGTPMLHCTLLVKVREGSNTVWFAGG